MLTYYEIWDTVVQETMLWLLPAPLQEAQQGRPGTQQAERYDHQQDGDALLLNNVHAVRRCIAPAGASCVGPRRGA